MPRAVPDCSDAVDDSFIVGSLKNQVVDLKTTIPSFQLNLIQPAKRFTAVLNYLDKPNFSLLFASTPVHQTLLICA